MEASLALVAMVRPWHWFAWYVSQPGRSRTAGDALNDSESRVDTASIVSVRCDPDESPMMSSQCVRQLRADALGIAHPQLSHRDLRAVEIFAVVTAVRWGVGLGSAGCERGRGVDSRRK